ncbi:MAG TPA: tripartite tricarboxylate transporter substrate-binding protein [Terriglobales bacterium]|jgi:tripartite-type tricarboxylate transporter receptor subunit TctC|nr:tripartite tricarboxylate transporter substrate-binding protein [Terriglobales bacterium]
MKILRLSIPSGCFGGGIASLLLLCSLAGPAHAQSESFYSGKTVRVVVGFTPGGFYDRWARPLARYMPKYIPGSPNFLVQNKPGASSVIAASYVYNIAKNDGLTLLVPINSLYLDQIVGRKEVKFDVRKLIFIGTQEKAPTMLYFRADSPFKSLADIIQAKEAPKCGSTGTASTGYLIAKLMDEAFKAKLNTVTAARSTSPSNAPSSSAAVCTSRPTSDASPSIAGTKTALTATFCKAVRSATRACRIRRRFLN